MRKKKYFRLINNIGTWIAIVGWTLDSRGCFKCSNQYSMMLGNGNVKIDIAKIISLDLDRISFGATISIIPPNNYNKFNKNPKDTISLLVEIPYFDYMNYVFKRVKTEIKTDKYTHTLLDLINITNALQKIKEN